MVAIVKEFQARKREQEIIPNGLNNLERTLADIRERLLAAESPLAFRVRAHAAAIHSLEMDVEGLGDHVQKLETK